MSAYRSAVGWGPGLKRGLTRGYNTFNAISGFGTARAGLGHYRRMVSQVGAGNLRGAVTSRAFARGAGRAWLTGGDVFAGGGFRPMRAGLAATRIGGAAAAGVGVADFLNPWGLGWGD